MEKIRFEYFGNASTGVFYGKELWLIDGLQEGAGDYEPTPIWALDKLAGFSGNIHLLVTHNHPDHFSRSLVADFCRQRPLELIFFDPPFENTVVDIPGLSLRYLEEGEWHDLLREGDGLQIYPIKMPHLSPKYFHLAHYGLLMGIEGRRFFFSADADLDEDAYGRNHQLVCGCDLAILVYAYGFTKKNLAFTEEYIKAKHLVFNHLPARDRDRQSIRQKFPRFLQLNSVERCTVFMDKDDAYFIS